MWFHLTFWKKQNYGSSEKNIGFQVFEWRKMRKQSPEYFYSSENTLYSTLMIDTCDLHLSKPRESTIFRINVCINSGLMYKYA